MSKRNRSVKIILTGFNEQTPGNGPACRGLKYCSDIAYIQYDLNTRIFKNYFFTISFFSGI